LGFGERVRVEAVDGVIVDVDEAGGQDEASRVDDGFVGKRSDFADLDDAFAGETKI
jgi:hypothetical protein